MDINDVTKKPITLLAEGLCQCMRNSRSMRPRSRPLPDDVTAHMQSLTAFSAV